MGILILIQASQPLIKQLNSTEISELIKQRIAQFNVVSEAHNEGTIVSVSDGVIRIHGLADCMQGEMISAYQRGLTSRLQATEARLPVLAEEMSLLMLDSRRVIQSIQLMKSLGGGYQAGPVVEKK